MRQVVSARIGAWRLTVSSLLLSLLAANAGAQVGTSPVAGIADRTPRTIALTHARLVVEPGSVVEDGTLLIRDGMIVAVGNRIAIPADAAVTDLGGRSVFAGFIDAGSDYGQPAPAPAARGEGMGRTSAASEASAGAGHWNRRVTPERRVAETLKPDAARAGTLRGNGFTSVLSTPKQGVFRGQAAPARVPDWLPEERKQRVREGVQKKRDALDGTLRDARAYQAAQRAGAISAADLRDEALLPVLEGRMPLLVLANDAVQIREALAFAAREKLRIVIVGGADAWRLAAAIKAQDVPVILGSSHNLPMRRWEGYDTVFAAAGRLAAAGVTLAIANDGDAMSAMNERNLPYQAASYAAHGLGADAALRAITLAPAQILGVADRLGSLETGKDATLFVADGDILDIRAVVERAWVAGREVDLANKQSRLYQQYQRKYRGEPKG